MAANIAYSLFSIPLALGYLGKENFGLWAVVLQIVGYLYLLDCGISQGISRLLIDEKDHRENGVYGSILLTGTIALCLIGGAVALIGWSVGPMLASIFAIPESLSNDFILLIGLQSTIAGIGIGARMLGAPFYAFQRQDLTSVSTILVFVVYLGTLWGGFKLGWGVYSMVFSQAGGLVCSVVFSVIAGHRLHLLPRGREWGKPSWNRFKGIFQYSRDLFLMGVGWQILSGSPILVISKILGLDAAAAWTVCYKPFAILLQFLSRPMDHSTPAFSEMFVRGETEVLRNRFRNIFQLTAALAAAGCMAFVAITPDFISIWTSQKISWPPINFVSLSLMVFTYAVFRLANGFVGVTKTIGALKFLFFLESVIFLGLSLISTSTFGVAIIPIIAVLCHLTISSPVGMHHLSETLGVPVSIILMWLRPSGLTILLMIPGVVLCMTWTPGVTALQNFIVRGIVISITGVIAMLVTLPTELREHLVGRIFKPRTPS